MDSSYLFAKNFTQTSYERLPQNVVEATKKLILDQIGVSLAGSAHSGVKKLKGLLTEWGGRKESTVLCYGGMLPAIHAAQINATMGHAVEYDDTHDSAMVHATVVTVPVGLAMAEYKGGLNGRDFITAVALGIDMLCRLGLATRPDSNLMGAGWHFTTLYGFMAAAGVAGKILEFDEEKLVNSFGIGYHQGSGNGQAVLDGANSKSMGPGFAVRGGIAAALMAKNGITGASNSIEGHFGLINLYHQGSFGTKILTADLGKHFEVTNISIKPFPCCRAIHAFIDAALTIVNETGIKAGDVQEIDIITYEGPAKVLGLPLELKCRPPTTIDAQFSIPWAVATAVARGKVTMEHYTDKAIHSQDILEVASKTKVEVDTEPSPTHVVDPGRVKITTKDGKVYFKQVDHALGSPEFPLTFNDCAEKFRDCASHAIKEFSRDNIERAINMIEQLENVEDVREIIKLLV
jgi:2-methylcitrate dehydratase PrpD